jgi:hypothetical protein
MIFVNVGRFIVSLLFRVPYGLNGHGLAPLVEALRYKGEGRGSIPDGVIGFFH